MAFDQIAVGPPALMAEYAAAFAVTLPRDVRAGRELYPERALGSHLAAAAVPLRQLRGFHASLARGGGHGGRVSFEDPYGKLKLDLRNWSAPFSLLRSGGLARRPGSSGGILLLKIHLTPTFQQNAAAAGRAPVGSGIISLIPITLCISGVRISQSHH